MNVNHKRQTPLRAPLSTLPACHHSQLPKKEGNHTASTSHPPLHKIILDFHAARFQFPRLKPQRPQSASSHLLIARTSALSDPLPTALSVCPGLLPSLFIKPPKYAHYLDTFDTHTTTQGSRHSGTRSIASSTGIHHQSSEARVEDEDKVEETKTLGRDSSPHSLTVSNSTTRKPIAKHPDQTVQ